MRAWISGWGALAVLLLAGCAGTSQAPADAAEAPPSAAGTGAIAGAVADEESIPVANASVAILELGLETTTDAGGAFRLGPVPAGTHVLVASAPGYAATTQSLDVAEDTTTEIAIELVLIPVVEPYYDILPYDGRFECSYAALDLFWNECPGASTVFPSSRNFVPFAKGEAATALVSELVWQATTTGTGQNLDFSLVQAERLACQWYANVFGPSVLRIEIAVGVPFENPESPYPTGTCGDAVVDPLDTALGLLIFASPTYVAGQATLGLTLQQPYEGYVTIFYDMPAPVGWSALPGA